MIDEKRGAVKGELGLALQDELLEERQRARNLFETNVMTNDRKNSDRLARAAPARDDSDAR